MSLALPWGRDAALPLVWPAHWPQPVVDRPDLSAPLSDYRSALARAFDRPEGSPRLEQLIEPGGRVAIVVDDPSRWTPVREVLPLLLERLHAAGVSADRISISVGVGRHHAVDDRAMRARVGDDVVDRYACYSPPLDDASQYTMLGTTPQGVPVRVFRPVAEAELRVLVGSVLPHLQAGFGGGYKLIFPGCSHRETLGALHRQGLGDNSEQAAALLGGSVTTNPMRQAISHAASLLPGVCVSISHLLGEPGQIFRVAFGDVGRVQAVLSTQAARRFRLPDRPAADLAVAGNFPWPGDPMMSFKALIHHREACRPGGVLVGLFWTDPKELDRSFPLRPLRAIAASGSPGGWLIRRGLKLADRVVARLGHPSRFMLHWARELVAERHVFVYAPPLHNSLGPRLGPVRLFDDLDTLWKAAESRLGRRPPRSARIFPEGGLSYVAYQPQAATSTAAESPNG